MVIDLKMCRFENVPWGFRLIGGSDFDVPLTVVKVTEGSIAEEAGMKVDDIIVRINDEATSKLSHNEAHEAISKCGNNFFFGILREGEVPVIENVANLHIIEEHPESELRDFSKSPAPQISEKIIEAEPNNNEIHQEKLSDEQIAELISGEAEVLKDHNVIGVNFNRIFPKPGVCMSSDVLRQLNDEAIKTKIEREKEKRKWTTFMQKPDRPIPKSKKEIEEEKHKQVNSYKVVIQKQPKPRVAPDHIPTPPPTPVPEPESVIETPIEETEDDSKPLSDNEVPDLEPIDSANVESLEDTNTTIVQSDEMSENQEEEAVQKEEAIEKEAETLEVEETVIEKSEEELILERQLADVQKQLMALSSLPSTIQATLDAVTKQLAELLPTFKLQPPVTVTENHEEETICEENDSHCESEYKTEDTDEAFVEDQPATYQEDKVVDEDEIQQIEILQDVELIEPGQASEPTLAQIEQDRQYDEERKAEEELNYKKQKDNGLMEELQQRLIKDRMPKRPARPFGPLVPQQRPLILPGGRRWRTPKDAFNEDFIAETLSSQAELIVGHTLGVNFLKYQKPEKKIDLEKSEVYKVIHHLDRQPKHGIEVRPARVMAEEDIRNRVQTPISCG